MGVETMILGGMGLASAVTSYSAASSSASSVRAQGSAAAALQAQAAKNEAEVLRSNALRTRADIGIMRSKKMIEMRELKRKNKILHGERLASAYSSGLRVEGSSLDRLVKQQAMHDEFVEDIASWDWKNAIDKKTDEFNMDWWTASATETGGLTSAEATRRSAFSEATDIQRTGAYTAGSKLISGFGNAAIAEWGGE